jgi:hypothetical protein
VSPGTKPGVRRQRHGLPASGNQRLSLWSMSVRVWQKSWNGDRGVAVKAAFKLLALFLMNPLTKGIRGARFDQPARAQWLRC